MNVNLMIVSDYFCHLDMYCQGNNEWSILHTIVFEFAKFVPQRDLISPDFCCDLWLMLCLKVIQPVVVLLSTVRK